MIFRGIPWSHHFGLCVCVANAILGKSTNVVNCEWKKMGVWRMLNNFLFFFWGEPAWEIVNVFEERGGGFVSVEMWVLLLIFLIRRNQWCGNWKLFTRFLEIFYKKVCNKNFDISTRTRIFVYVLCNLVLFFKWVFNNTMAILKTDKPKHLKVQQNYPSHALYMAGMPKNQNKTPTSFYFPNQKWLTTRQHFLPPHKESVTPRHFPSTLRRHWCVRSHLSIILLASAFRV